MGLSSSKSKQTTAFNPQAAPYMYGAANTVQNTYNAQAPGLAATAGQVQGFASGLGQRVFGANPLADSAKAYATDVLGGKYLGANPWMDGMAQQARDATFNDVATRFGRSGMTGGTGFGESLGRGMTLADQSVRYNDYNAERARMDAMAGNAGSISTSDLAALPQYLALTQAGADLPFTASNNLASSLAALLGNQQTTTTKSSPSLGSILGSVLQTASLLKGG